MNKQKRFVLLSLALIAMLLLAAAPSPSGSGLTPFDAIVYPCSADEPARYWESKDGTIHVRGEVNYGYMFAVLPSGDPRLNGSAVWRSNQDVDSTGNGRMWGTMKVETGVGNWNITWRATLGSGIPTSHGVGHGSHGLQGQVMFYEGVLTPPDDQNPCNAEVAVMFSGFILNRKGD